MPYIETANCVRELLEILKCDSCNKALHQPYSLGACDHIICIECCSASKSKSRKTSANVCPVCSLSFRPADVKIHCQWSSLVVSARKIIKLTDGGNYDENLKTIERPKLNDEKTTKQILDEAQTKKTLRPVRKPKRFSDESLDSTIIESKNSEPKSIDRKSRSKKKVNARGETLLHRAAIRNNVTLAKELLSNSCEVDPKDYGGWTPIHEASVKGYTEMVELLLSFGANPNIPGGPNQETPLFEAIQNGHLTTIKALVKHGADILIPNANGYNCIQLIDNICLSFENNDCKPKRQSKILPPLKEYEEIQKFIHEIRNKNPSDGKTARLDGSSTLTNTMVNSKSSIINFLEKSRSKPVFLASGINRTQKTLLNKVASMLHAIVVNNFTPEVTHLIIQASPLPLRSDSKETDKTLTCPRTLKFLNAILCGCWIVSFEWIEHSAYLKMKVEEECFEITSCSKSAPDSQAPMRARISKESGSPGLFHGYSMCFIGNFVYPLPTKNELIALAKQGGAIVHHREVHTPQRLAALVSGLDEPISANDTTFCITAAVNANSSWTLSENGPGNYYQMAKDALLSTEPVDKRSFIVLHAKETRDDQLIVLCTAAIKLLSPQINSLGEIPPPPIRVINVNWLMNCIADFKILDGSHFK